jgi:hypothetical protein
LEEKREGKSKFDKGHQEGHPTDGFLFLLVQKKENGDPDEGKKSDPRE